MKMFKLSMTILGIVLFFALVFAMPSLGGRSLGMVGGWVWKSMWALFGMVGAAVLFIVAGSQAVRRVRGRGPSNLIQS
ncbi:MAG: hypothetical protein KC561_00365 [Myxococcales bacterium]|nr:hypothetical protein [Myxococcales bacterium]